MSQNQDEMLPARFRLASMLLLAARVCVAQYAFPFGAGLIGAPGNAMPEGNDFIQPGAYPSAEYCGRCHQEAYSQWRQALHSNSFRTPFYRTSVNILLRTKGIEFTRHCDSCHNPIGVLSGALTADSKVEPRLRRRWSHLHDLPLDSKRARHAGERRLRNGNSRRHGG